MRNWLTRLFSSQGRSISSKKPSKQRQPRRLILDRLEDRLAPAITPLPLYGEGLSMPRFPDEANVRTALGIAFAPLSISVANPVQNSVYNSDVLVNGSLSLVNSGQLSLVYQIDGGNAGAVPVYGTQFSFIIPVTHNGAGDGSHTIRLTAFDQSGRVATAQVFVRIDTIAPTITAFDLAAGSDTAPVGDHSTTASTVSLTGTTEAGATVFLQNSGATTTADANGSFTFANLALPLGSTTFNVLAFDAAGNQSVNFGRTITRTAASVNPIVTVNALTTNDTTPTITGTVDSATTVVVTVNGQNYNATITGTTWSANVTNTLAAGPYTVSALATNAGNNTGTGTGNLVVDLTAPTVSITSSQSSPTNSTSIPITVTFSKAVTGFVASELTATNGTLSNFTAVNGGTTYTATLTPTGSGAATVNVAAGVANDTAGNANAAGTFSIVFDNVVPSATITSTASNPTSLLSIPITITFSEDVIGLTAAGLSATNGTISGVTAVDGHTYNATVSPSANGTVTVNLAAAAAHDAAGNNNTAATFSITADSVGASTTITSTLTGPTNSTSIPITVTFGEDVTGFVAGDIVVTNGTLSNFAATNGHTYTATITPAASGTVTVNVAAGVALDSANNGNVAATTFSIAVDLSTPLTAIESTAISPTKQATVPITVRFSEDVLGFSAAGINVVNATLSNFTVVDGRTYTATLTPTADGTVSATVPAGAAHDAAGNANLQGTFTIVSDRTAPTVAITSTASSPTTLAAIPITATFSEDVLGLIASDFNVVNGTLSNLTAVNGHTYTAFIAPIANGTVTVSLPAGAAVDEALNQSVAATFSIAALVRPSVAITSTLTSPTNSTAIPITITFSDSVTGFTAAGITVTGGTLGALNAVSGTTYTTTVTPTAQGVVTVDVADSAAQDADGDGNFPGTFSITSDTVAPAVSITSTVTGPTNLTAIPITITFSEDVLGMTAADVAVGNGTLVNFIAVDGHTYTATVTPTADGTVTIDVAAAAAHDAAGNDNAAGTTFSIDVDITAPTVVIASLGGNSIKTPIIPITVTFSEDVLGFSETSIAVTNGTLSDFVALNGHSYTATVTAAAEGLVKIDIAAGAAHDAVNNLSVAGTLSVDYDITAPMVTIASSAVDPTNSTSIPVTFTFSENVLDFTAADVVVSNGTLGNFTAVNGKTYTATIAPAGDGSVTVDVAAAAAQDAAGNDSAAATQFSIVSDRTAPTASIASTATSPTNLTAIPLTITFSENVTGLTVADFAVTNGTIGNLVAVNGHSYTATLAPAADGVVTVDLPLGAAQDAAGNGSLAATTFSITADIPPSVAITTGVTSPTHDSPFHVTFTFSEDVTGFDLADVAVTNGTSANFVTIDARTYSVDVSPTADGQVTVDVAAGAAQDSSNQDNLPATFSIVSDRTAPIALISSTASDPTNLAAIPIDIAFNEDVHDLTLADFVVTGGTLSNLTATNGHAYTATVTPTGDGLVTVSLVADAAFDAAGNGNATTSFSIDSDRTAPSASISTPVVGSTNLASFQIVVAFSENVTGFTDAGIAVANGTLSNFIVVDAKTYHATVSPTADGLLTINVAAGVAHDAAGNLSTADSYSVIYDSVAPTVAITSTATSPTNLAPIPISITFSENVNSFTAADVAVANGTLSNFVAVNGHLYTAVVTPSNGVVTVNVAAAAAQDDAGNDNVAGNFSITFDSLPPVPTITRNANDPTNGPMPITIAFNEDVSGFVADDVAVTNGTVSNFVAVDAKTYTATITPTTSGLISVNVAVAAAQDLAGNDSAAAATLSFTYDGVAPTASITSTAVNPTNATSIPITITFSEDVSGFTIAGLSAVNGTLSNFATTDAKTYTATLTPAADGAVTVNLLANSAHDAAANGNSVATFSIVSDTTGPVPTISPLVGNPTNKTSFLITISFDENVTGLTDSDFTITNGVLSDLTQLTGSSFSALISPTTSGLVTIDLAASAVTDALGNLSSAATRSLTADLVAPTVAVTSTTTSPTNSTTVPVTFTFSEDVVAFDSTEVTMTNGTLSGFTAVDGHTYTATATPTANGTMTIAVLDNAVRDAAGNAVVAGSLSITYDNVAPTAVITSTSSDPATTFPIPIYVNFGENVTGFTSGDVSVTNGTIFSFAAVDATTYLVYVTPTAPGVVTIDVAGAVATDTAGNANVGGTFSITTGA